MKRMLMMMMMMTRGIGGHILNPQPSTRNLEHETQNPESQTQNPRPQNPKPKTQNPKPTNPQTQTPDRRLQTPNTKHQTPNTKHPEPQTRNRGGRGGRGTGCWSGCSASISCARTRYQFENNYFTEMCSGSEAGSYLRRHIDFCITQL